MSATTVPPAPRAFSHARHLVAVALRLLRVDGEHVPVERAPARERHLRHQLHLGVGEAAQAAVGDVLERRALVLAHRAAQREHFVVGGPARRDRLAVAVGVRERERGGEPEPARGERVVQQRGDRVELLGRRLVADAVGAHHVAAQRAVADHEPDVERDPAVERAEVVGERAPVPRHAVLERGERHALDLRHHPAEVVGVVGRDRREREAAVAGDHARDAVQVRRARGRVPEQLRVVVRVRVDDAGRDHEAAGVDRLGRVVGHVADLDDAAVADARRRPGAPGAPVPSTTVPPLITQSSIGDLLRPK